MRLRLMRDHIPNFMALTLVDVEIHLSFEKKVYPFFASIRVEFPKMLVCLLNSCLLIFNEEFICRILRP